MRSTSRAIRGGAACGPSRSWLIDHNDSPGATTTRSVPWAAPVDDVPWASALSGSAASTATDSAATASASTIRFSFVLKVFSSLLRRVSSYLPAQKSEAGQRKPLWRAKRRRTTGKEDA
jgi:hypothetical protein